MTNLIGYDVGVGGGGGLSRTGLRLDRLAYRHRPYTIVAHFLVNAMDLGFATLVLQP